MKAKEGAALSLRRPMRKPKTGQKTAVKPGPKPDILKIGGKWQDAIKKSLVKKKPVEGWPK